MDLFVCFTQVYTKNIPPPGVEEKGGIDFYKRRIETMFIIKSCLSKTLVVTNLLAEGLSVDCLQDLSLNSSQGLCRASPMWLTTFPLQPFTPLSQLRTLCQSASPNLLQIPCLLLCNALKNASTLPNPILSLFLHASEKQGKLAVAPRCYIVSPHLIHCLP